MNWPKTPDGWRYDEATGEFKAALEHHGVRIGEASFSAKMMRELLASRGCLVASAEERAVLDAVTAIPEAALRSWMARRFVTVLRLARAELARRGLAHFGDQIAPDTADPAEKQPDSR